MGIAESGDSKTNNQRQAFDREQVKRSYGIGDEMQKNPEQVKYDLTYNVRVIERRN